MPTSNHAHRPFIVAAVMTAQVMVAIEATIVSTVMPQIVADLSGLDLYSWVFSSFLLAQTTMTVVFGKLADVIGRRPMMLLGIAIFLVGSLLAGFAPSMPWLIAFRLIQGIGAAAIQPLCVIIVADYYPAAERGKVQGYLASVWAIAAVLGPMVGGVIIHHLSWSWIFWINLPIGLIAAGIFVRYMRHDTPLQRPSVDMLGALLFTVAMASLMMVLSDGVDLPSGWIWKLLALCAASAIGFVWQERRVADPMVSFALWGGRAIAATNTATLLAGMALLGLTTFLPMYAQGVLHQTPIVAGMVLTLIMLGWPCGATVAARNFTRTGLRPVMIAGSVFIPLGALFMVFLHPGSSPVQAGIGSLIMGFGMGLLSIGSLILIPEIVDRSQQGSAMASNLFSRNLGSTLGAALFGAVLNYGLNNNRTGSAITSDQIKHALRSNDARSAVVSEVLQHSLHLTFISVFGVSACILALVLLIPRAAIRHLSKDTLAEKARRAAEHAAG
ncbi:MDR family MFS transporter [Bordetella sp. FB-8]|uniref:MDR family MFS transporter n=1 Tax=Bordetella sp. FB-8 TaxID=1159870 RepID=UPI000373E56E|nr:MDR family MFS transporter [Bordetella sp. FB-8]